MQINDIIELISNLFTKGLFLPFKWLRLTLAKEEYGWWMSNAVNWVFVLVLVVLLGWWLSQALKFKREGTEDIA